MNERPPARRRVVILGAGYAGVRAARDLARRAGHELEVVLVNPTNRHFDITMFYEVATAYLSRESSQSSEIIERGVGAPLADMFRRLPVRIHQGVAERIETAQRLIHLTDGKRLSYDYLVLAIGSELATFNIPGVAEQAFSVKILSDAMRLRHHIVAQFHHACDLAINERKAALTFVIVGGGASGVETAAELTGCAMQQCSKHKLSPQEVRIVLVEAGERLLGNLPPHISQYAKERLEKLGVTVRFRQRISEVRSDGVSLEGGENIPTLTTVWTAGLSPHQLLATSDLPRQRWGVETTQTLQAAGHPTVFVAGDAAIITSYSEELPATVPVAYTQGSLVARNIMHHVRGEPLETYRYRTVGALIALGGKSALALLPRNHFLVGFLPWMLKRLVSLRYWLGYLSFPQAVALWWRGLRLHTANDSGSMETEPHEHDRS